MSELSYTGARDDEDDTTKTSRPMTREERLQQDLYTIRKINSTLEFYLDALDKVASTSEVRVSRA